MTVPEAIEPVIKPAAGGVKEKTRNKWFRNVRKQPPVGKVPKGLPPKAVSPEGTQSAVGNRASGRRYGSGVWEKRFREVGNRAAGRHAPKGPPQFSTGACTLVHPEGVGWCRYF